MNTETMATLTLDTRHETKTNKTKNKTQRTKKLKDEQYRPHKIPAENRGAREG